MDFQFILPLTNSDLLNSSRDTYYVKHLYSPGEIPEKLKACKQMLYQGDPFYLFDHFDTYYAVIENKNTDSAAMTNLMRSFDLLYLTVEKLGNRLAPFLAVSEQPTNQERTAFLNLTKMSLFLIVNVVRKIEANMTRLQQQQQTNQQKKRGRHADTVEQYPDWDTKRGKFLVQLYNVMQFPLEKLWIPPMAEENFVNVEKKMKIETVAPPPKDDAKKKMRPPTAPKLDSNTYKTMAGSSQYRFGVLAKIVKHMRTRHQDGDDHPLTLEEILDETNQLDVGQSVKNWLGSEALMNNPKIEVSPDGIGFSFKPVYKIKDGKSLLRLLKQHALKGLGGILLEDIQESLPHCEKVLKNLASEIIFIVRPIDKKKILFYNDRTANFTVDEEFQKLWRSATVDAMDDAKIDEYLKKKDIRSMQDHGPKKPLSKRK